MLPGIEMMACTDLAVPNEVMRHVVQVESSFNPYAIGVVGGRLARQPKNLGEALSTTRMLEREGFNFSLGIAQVNRYNLAKQGLDTYEKAFGICPNVQAGSRILAECYKRSGQDWGKAFSCYYSGNFTTGFRHGYVDKVIASWRGATVAQGVSAIPVIRTQAPRSAGPVRQVRVPVESTSGRVLRRIEEAALARTALGSVAATPAPVYPGYPANGAPPVQGSLSVQDGQSGSPAWPAGPARVGGMQASDAPVLLQPMGAPPVSQPAAGGASSLPENGAAAPALRAPAPAPRNVPPERDAALVF